MRDADFLDPIVADKPPGCWTLSMNPSNSRAVLRSLAWPGYFFFHEVKCRRTHYDLGSRSRIDCESRLLLGMKAPARRHFTKKMVFSPCPAHMLPRAVARCPQVPGSRFGILLAAVWTELHPFLFSPYFPFFSSCALPSVSV